MPPSKVVELEVRGGLPTFTSLPASVSGVPLNVMAPERDMAGTFRVFELT